MLPFTNPQNSKAAAAAPQIVLLTTDASVIHTFRFGFDKMFSWELMLRLKRPFTAVQEALISSREGRQLHRRRAAEGFKSEDDYYRKII